MGVCVYLKIQVTICIYIATRLSISRSKIAICWTANGAKSYKSTSRKLHNGTFHIKTLGPLELETAETRGPTKIYATWLLTGVKMSLHIDKKSTLSIYFQICRRPPFMTRHCQWPLSWKTALEQPTWRRPWQHFSEDRKRIYFCIHTWILFGRITCTKRKDAAYCYWCSVLCMCVSICWT